MELFVILSKILATTAKYLVGIIVWFICWFTLKKINMQECLIGSVIWFWAWVALGEAIKTIISSLLHR